MSLQQSQNLGRPSFLMNASDIQTNSMTQNNIHFGWSQPINELSTLLYVPLMPSVTHNLYINQG